jgi:hypothetical protein
MKPKSITAKNATFFVAPSLLRWLDDILALSRYIERVQSLNCGKQILMKYRKAAVEQDLGSSESIRNPRKQF